MTAILQDPSGNGVATYPTLGTETGVTNDSYPYDDLRRYGATCDGLSTNTLDTIAFIARAASINNAGGGDITLPNNTTLATSAWSAILPGTPVVTFTNCVGVKVRALGTVNVPRVFTANTTLDLMDFTGCVGVEIDIPSIVGDSGAGASQTTPTGIYVARFNNFGRNFRAKISATNCAGLVLITGTVGAADSARTKGGTVDLIVNNCEYGLVCQFNGDDIEGKILSSSVHRSYFVYGVRNHRVRVESANNHADDCLLRCYSGSILEDIDLTYINKKSASALTAAPGVSLAPDVNAVSSFAPGVMRNITLNVHVEYDGTNGPGHAIYLYKTLSDTTIDTTDRGHIIDGLTIRAYVKGSNSPNSAFPMLLGGTWGGGETMSNIRVERFECDTVNAATYLYFPSLKDRALIMNAIGNHYFYLYAGTAGKITAIGCKGQALVIGTGDTSWIDYIDCEVTAAGTTAYVNKTFQNTTINGTMLNTIGRVGGIVAARFNQLVTPSFSVPTATATAILTPTVPGIYDVCVNNTGTGAAANGRCTVGVDGAGNVAILGTPETGASCSFSVVGGVVKYTQTTGSTITVNATAVLKG